MENNIWQKLAQEFPETEVQWRIESKSKDGTKALVVPYIDARAVMDRLDEVVGPENWADSYEFINTRSDSNGNVYEVRCTLTVNGIVKQDVGEGDTLKGAFSDALKRAAVKFGIGRYLYGMDKHWVEVDQYGRFTPPTTEPKAKPQAKPQAKPVAQPKPAVPAASHGNEATEAQRKAIFALAREKLFPLIQDEGMTKEDLNGFLKSFLSHAIGRKIESSTEITKAEASKVIEMFKDEDTFLATYDAWDPMAF